jgi:hypothetical protein
LKLVRSGQYLLKLVRSGQYLLKFNAHYFLNIQFTFIYVRRINLGLHGEGVANPPPIFFLSKNIFFG